MLIEPRELYPTGGGAQPVSVLDVRSPVEVARGSLPGAESMPLLSDDERHRVGLRYKEAGQDAAVALGYEITATTLPQRVQAWREVAACGPTAVTCWRGGLRSKLTVEFIGDPNVAQVNGGYKAVRAHLVHEMQQVLNRRNLVVLAGLSGAGKTRLLRALRTPAVQVIDLESEARHRGSSFGATAEAQPSQQTFENAVAAAIVLGTAPVVVVEDESRYVGRRTLPAALLGAMSQAPLVVLEVPLAERIDNLYQEYVRAPAEAHSVERIVQELETNTLRLRKRLGGGRTKRIVAALHANRQHWFDPAAHYGWLGDLLGYYDRLYSQARNRQARPVAFSGDAAAVSAWLADGAVGPTAGRLGSRP